MSGDDFALTLNNDEGTAVSVVSVCGVVDLETGPLLTHTLQLALERGGGVVVDLSEVTFLDSSGIHALLDAQRHADGQRIVLRHPSRFVSRILELACVTDLFEVEDGDGIDRTAP
jgi:stage II sporulation protein AA (anti-sigma F factor antagonist)